MSGGAVSGPAAPTADPIILSDNPLEEAPIGRRQLAILAVMVLLAALDGYDALAMAFVAPVLGRSWHLDRGTIGLLLSCGLAGMAVGSLAISPLADRIGRRPTLLASLAVATVGALLSAVAGNVLTLAVSRIVTGVGIGVLVVLTTLQAAEFSNARRRMLAVAAVATIGFPLGGILGGMSAGLVLRSASWQWVFLIGAAAGLVLLIVSALVLVESLPFLQARPASAAGLARLNKVLVALGHRAIGGWQPAQSASRTHYRQLFRGGQGPVTIRMVAINLLLALAAYYIVNWLPQLVTDAGFPAASGAFVSAASGLIGLFGGVVLSSVANRFGGARVAAAAALTMAFSLAAIGLVPPLLSAFVIVAGIYGFFATGTAGLFYGLMVSSFSPLERASGVGLVMGVGRVASAFAPSLAGLLFSHGLTRASVSLLFAAEPLMAAMLMAGLAHRNSSAAASPIACACPTKGRP